VSTLESTRVDMKERTVDLAAAWDELHAATPPGWFVGRPGQRHGGQWEQYAFDTTEKAHIGRRSQRR